MSKKTIVHCPNEYASSCEHYKLSAEYRSSESKSRLIALGVGTVGLVISGLEDVNNPGWFVTIMIYLLSCIGTSLFYSRDKPVKRVCYRLLNAYSVLLLVACFLGISGVLIVNNGMLQMARQGVFEGQVLIKARTAYFALFAIPAADAFAWVVSALMDNRIHSKTDR